MKLDDAKQQAKQDFRRSKVPQAVVQTGRFGNYSTTTLQAAKACSLTVFYAAQDRASRGKD